MTNNVVSLLKEAKPYYFKKKRQKQVITSVASALGMIALVFSFTFNSYEAQYSQEEFDEMAYGSVIYDYGFDVDEYGLLNV